MRNLPSFIKDTTEFVNLVEQTQLPRNCILASIDVSSLYTNIPHLDGKLAAMQALAQIENPDPRQPPPEVIGELIDIVLQNNVFEFNGKFYLQKQGTAMGTKMAPAYANMFMGNLEPKLQTEGKGEILIWKRFIDDIFIVWTGTKEPFLSFMGKINTHHPTIKFTYESSETEITFLDITLYKGTRFQESGILDIKTHIKPTNKQLYVHATSYHPTNTGKSITIGETNRYIRTNSDEQNFTKMVSHLQSKLRQRGYKKSQIKPYTSSLPFSTRKHILKPKTTPDLKPNPIVLATPYCDKINELKAVLRDSWKELHTNERLRNIFPEPPRIAYKKNPSLRNKLVRAKLPPFEGNPSSNPDPSPNPGPDLNSDPNPGPNPGPDPNPNPDPNPGPNPGLDPNPNPHPNPNPNPDPNPSEGESSGVANTNLPPIYTGKLAPTFKQQRQFPFNLFQKKKVVKPCCKKLCKTCKRLIHTSNFVKSKVSKRYYPIQAPHKPLTCQSSRVIYLLQCDQYQKQYVGQTTQPLHIRINQHVQNLTRTTYSNLWWHFNNDHTIDDLKVIPLQQVDGYLPLPQAEAKLQQLETLWISRLATMQPLGMNLIRSDSQRRT